MAKKAKKKVTKAGTKTKRATAARGSRKAATKPAASGPSIPLRDLLRDGMPRSPKAPRSLEAPGPGPWAQKRTRTAHGMKRGAGLMQAPPRPPQPHVRSR